MQAAGEQGDTAPPPPEQDVDLHFIAFVEHEGEAPLAANLSLLPATPALGMFIAVSKGMFLAVRAAVVCCIHQVKSYLNCWVQGSCTSWTAAGPAPSTMVPRRRTRCWLMSHVSPRTSSQGVVCCCHTSLRRLRPALSQVCVLRAAGCRTNSLNFNLIALASAD